MSDVEEKSAAEPSGEQSAEITDIFGSRVAEELSESSRSTVLKKWSEIRGQLDEAKPRQEDDPRRTDKIGNFQLFSLKDFFHVIFWHVERNVDFH